MAATLRQGYDSTVEYLRRAQALDLRIDAGFERIQKLRALAQRRTAVYGRERVRGGGASDPMDVVARIVDAERALDEMIDRMLAQKEEIAAVIARVPDERMRGLLERRYLNGNTWEEVAEAMNYTTRNVYNLHNAALKAVALLIPPVPHEGDSQGTQSLERVWAEPSVAPIRENPRNLRFLGGSGQSPA